MSKAQAINFTGECFICGIEVVMLKFVIEKSKVMKNIFTFLLVASFFGIIGTSCSKCYDCSRSVVIEDSQGNPIDTTNSSEEVCTADEGEIDNREAEGYSCS